MAKNKLSYSPIIISWSEEALLGGVCWMTDDDGGYLFDSEFVGTWHSGENSYGDLRHLLISGSPSRRSDRT